ncbi:XRE family transcriptional regulator [Mycoplasmatota bacterium WC44]
MNIDIGRKIKELRTKNSLTLRELGEMTELSTGFLSQLERGLTTIAVDSLEAIAKALDVSLSFFFSVPRKRESSILRSYEREIFNKNELGFIDYLLSNDLTDKNILPRIIEVLPSLTHEEVEVYQHKGEEFIYILEGILTLYIDDQRSDLYPGDSAHINSNIGHNWANYSNKIVKLLAINTPNRFKS